MTLFTVVGSALIIFCLYRLGRALLRREMIVRTGLSYHWEPVGNRLGQHAFGVLMHVLLLAMAIIVLAGWIHTGAGR